VISDQWAVARKSNLTILEFEYHLVTPPMRMEFH
jgi:hypothetical protein